MGAMNVDETRTTLSATARPANEVSFDDLELEFGRLHELIGLIERRAESALLERNPAAVGEDLGEIRRAAQAALVRLADLRWCE